MTASQSLPSIELQKIPTGVATAGPLNAEELELLVTQAEKSVEFAYFYGETANDLIFGAYPPSQPSHAWLEARAFGKNGMLHWRQQNWRSVEGDMQPRFQVVFVGVNSSLPPNMLFELFDPNQISQVETVVRLRGERLPGQPAWLEPRTPRLLGYPWSDAKTQILALRLIEYRRTGRVEFMQWVDLQPWKAR